MKKLKLLFTGIGVVLLLTTAYSQTEEPVNLSVIPPSPNSLSFMKFGDIAISPYSGIPKIDIPLYSYSGKYINLPISLKYHAGGIRVEEIAPSVGLGWALVTGGSVSRTVRGLADDMATYGYLADGDIQNCSGIFTPFFPESKCYDYYRGAIDAEQDIFHVNTGNLSFKFTIAKDGTPEIDPQLKVKIEKSTGSLGGVNSYGNITEWIITDESGVKYTFSKKEFSKSESSSSLFSPHASKYVVTSWYLTEIAAPFDFETVIIEYDEYTYKYSLNMSETINNQRNYIETYSEIYMIAQRISKITTPDSATIIFNYDNTGYRCDLKGDRVLTNISISSPDKEIKDVDFTYKYMLASGFETYSSCSLGGTHQLGKRLVLAKIEESGKNPYKFTYRDGLPSRDSKSQDHWGFYNGVANTTLLPKTYYYIACFGIGYREIGNADRKPDTGYVKCGTLTKIEYPTGGSTSFEYEINQATDRFLEYSLVNKNYSLDGQTYTIENIEINREQLPYSGLKFSIHILPPSFQDGSCGVRALIKDGSVTKYYVDFKKADYDTGFRDTVINANLKDGIYQFTFQYLGNEFVCPDPEDPFSLTLEYANESTDNNKNAGGIRIKRIIDNPSLPDSGNENIKWYEYTFDNNSSSGYILNHPVYLTLFDVYGLDCFFGSLTSSSRAFLGNTQGSPVGYSRVIEHFGLNSENGFTEYWYTSPQNYQDLYGFVGGLEFPFPPPSSHENCRGLLTKQIIYDKDGVIVQKIDNSYDISSTFGDGLTNMKVGIDESWVGDGTILIGQAYTNYQIKANLSSNRSVSFFPPNDSVVKVKDYTYSLVYNKLATQKTSTLSDGTYIVNKYYYPQDFNSGVSDANDIMFNGNNFNEILIKESWKGTDENNLKMINTQVNVYKDSISGKVFLDKVYTMKADEPLTKTQILEFDPDVILRKPEYYHRELKVNKSDTHDNILEYLKDDGVPTSFIWGYNSIYPVVKIEGIEYDDIPSSIKTNISGRNYVSSSDYVNVKVDVDYLKGQLSSLISNTSYMVTIYTYDPLVGMTSQTNPNGITTYYEYDNYGRLEYVKDDDGRILKTYEYHYYNQ